MAAVGAPTPNALAAATTQPAATGTTDDGTLTIVEAKARLARTFGVDPSNMKITVEAYATVAAGQRRGRAPARVR